MGLEDIGTWFWWCFQLGTHFLPPAEVTTTCPWPLLPLTALFVPSVPTAIISWPQILVLGTGPEGLFSMVLLSLCLIGTSH